MSAPSSVTPAVVCLLTLEALEDAVRHGLLAEWRALADADPVASVFQVGEWCLAWYRAYAPQFSPHIVLLREEGALVALLPLARELQSGRIAFAGDHMADYRDVAARPAARRRAVDQLLTELLTTRQPGLIRVGYMQPDSPTPHLLREAAHSRGLPTIDRAHACFRVWFTEPGIADALARKESVRRNVNALKRSGAIELRRIQSLDEWNSARQTFFDHHSLRQLRAGRAISFTDPLKQDFYDRLFRECPDLTYAHLLLVGGKVVAEHVGCAWRGIAYFGAPAFDLVFERRSPGQVILARILVDAQAAGMRGMDLTIGESTYKQRFGTEQVFLPSVEIYRSKAHWLRARSRDFLVSGVKRAVRRYGKPGAWESLVRRVRRAPTAIVHPYERQLEQERMGEAAVPLLIPAASATPSGELRENDLATVLTLEDRQLQAILLNEALVRTARGDTFIAAMMGGRLTAWCFIGRLTDVEGELELYSGCGVVEGARESSVLDGLLRASAAARTASGASRAVALLAVRPHSDYTSPPDAGRLLQQVREQGTAAAAGRATGLPINREQTT